MSAEEWAEILNESEKNWRKCYGTVILNALPSRLSLKTLAAITDDQKLNLANKVELYAFDS